MGLNVFLPLGGSSPRPSLMAFTKPRYSESGMGEYPSVFKLPVVLASPPRSLLGVLDAWVEGLKNAN